MKLAIGNDHAAVELKIEIRDYLASKGIEMVDLNWVVIPVKAPITV